VYICCGFSGHGFKFGTVIGEIMASMALGREISLPIERFRINREVVRNTTGVDFVKTAPGK